MKLKNYTLVYFFCFSAFIMLAQDKQNTSSFIRPSLTLIEVTYGEHSLIKPNELKFSPGIDITNIKTQSINIGDKSNLRRDLLEEADQLARGVKKESTNWYDAYSQYNIEGVRAFDEKVMAATFKIASDLIETNLYPNGGNKMDFKYLNNRAKNSISSNQMKEDKVTARGDAGESNFTQENKTRMANRFYLSFYTVEKMEWIRPRFKGDFLMPTSVKYSGRFILVKFDDFERFLFKTYRKEYKELKELTPAQLQEKFKYSYSELASKFGGSKISYPIYGSATSNRSDVIKSNEIYNSSLENNELLQKAPTDESLIAEAKQNFAYNMQKIISKMVEDFKVISPLVGLKPFTANIGTKEFLKKDDLFIIYEILAQDSIGNPTKKEKIATFRVKKASNNSITTATNNPSVFYKIGGGKPDVGMLMQKKEEFGLGISVGYGYDASLRIDYRVKRKRIKLYLDLNLLRNIAVLASSGEIAAMKYDNNKFNSLPGMLAFGGIQTKKPISLIFNLVGGYEKTLMLGSRFGLTPFIGGGASFVSLAGEAFSWFNPDVNKTVTYKYDPAAAIYSSYLFNGGVRANIFLSGNLSLVTSVGFSMPVIEGWGDIRFVNKDDESDVIYAIGGLKPSGNKITNQLLFETNKVIINPPKTANGLIYNLMLRYEF